MTAGRTLPVAGSSGGGAGAGRERGASRHPDLRAERAAVAAFAAFRERHYESYLQYTEVRIGHYGPAERVVAEAFTELAVSWTAVLGSSGPAAVAWDILHEHIDHALGAGSAFAPSEKPARSLHLEAHVLCRRLRLSSERVAELLGRPVDDIRGLLPPPCTARE
ncbi:hypothetical protein [Streptomyces sp. NPDC005435]|uniref:hypothetical protein n=1 Tax=Streptomyces sp. NPDC005435 TaxID=3154464 RepID=UPI0034557A82